MNIDKLTDPEVRFYRGMDLTRQDLQKILQDGIVSHAVKRYGIDYVERVLQDRIDGFMDDAPTLDIRANGYRQIPHVAGWEVDYMFVAPWFTTEPREAARYALGFLNGNDEMVGQKRSCFFIVTVRKSQVYRKNVGSAKPRHKIFSSNGQHAQWLDPIVPPEAIEVRDLGPYLGSYPQQRGWRESDVLEDLSGVLDS